MNGSPIRWGGSRYGRRSGGWGQSPAPANTYSSGYKLAGQFCSWLHISFKVMVAVVWHSPVQSPTGQVFTHLSGGCSLAPSLAPSPGLYLCQHVLWPSTVCSTFHLAFKLSSVQPAPRSIPYTRWWILLPWPTWPAPSPSPHTHKQELQPKTGLPIVSLPSLLSAPHLTRAIR